MRWLRIAPAVIVLFSLTVWPQTPAATIKGRVVDSTSATIIGATVDAISIDTNVKYTAQTNKRWPVRNRQSVSRELRDVCRFSGGDGAAVSTVVDRNFVANTPLNGRSFQDLISMTPGVVTQAPNTSLSRKRCGWRLQR